jgi:hypothetical protein
MRINHRVATRHTEQPDAILFGWRLQVARIVN